MRSTRSAVSPQDSKGSGSKGNDKSSQTITLPAISPAKMTKGRRLKVLFADGNWYPGIVSREKSERLVDVEFDDGDKCSLNSSSRTDMSEVRLVLNDNELAAVLLKIEEALGEILIKHFLDHEGLAEVKGALSDVFRKPNPTRSGTTGRVERTEQEEVDRRMHSAHHVVVDGTIVNEQAWKAIQQELHAGLERYKKQCDEEALLLAEYRTTEVGVKKRASTDSKDPKESDAKGSKRLCNVLASSSSHTRKSLPASVPVKETDGADVGEKKGKRRTSLPGHIESSSSAAHVDNEEERRSTRSRKGDSEGVIADVNHHVKKKVKQEGSDAGKARRVSESDGTDNSKKRRLKEADGGAGVGEQQHADEKSKLLEKKDGGADKRRGSNAMELEHEEGSAVTSLRSGKGRRGEEEKREEGDGTEVHDAKKGGAAKVEGGKGHEEGEGQPTVTRTRRSMTDRGEDGAGEEETRRGTRSGGGAAEKEKEVGDPAAWVNGLDGEEGEGGRLTRDRARSKASPAVPAKRGREDASAGEAGGTLKVKAPGGENSRVSRLSVGVLPDLTSGRGGRKDSESSAPSPGLRTRGGIERISPANRDREAGERPDRKSVV